MPKQRLFVAVLILESRVGPRDDSPIVDHQVRVIAAPSAAAAYTHALETGKAENATVKGADGASVTWTFLGLSELAPLDERQVRDGGELLSWRTRGPGLGFVVEKDALSAFGPKAKNRTR